MGPKLFFYFVRNFLLWVGVGFFVCSVLIFLIDIVELLRRSSDLEIPFSTIVQISFLRLPGMVQQLTPFAFLFGAILYFTKLNRRLEIVIARASGVSVWQFLTPPILTSLVLGAFVILAFNPLAAAMNQRSSEITDNYFEGNVSRIKVSDSGLWLKQINANKSETLLSAATISADNKKFRDVSIFEFDNSDNFVQRIDAEIGTLKQGYWQFKNVIVNKPDMLPEKIDKFKMRTKLTLLQIQESFSEPESLSFWQLPKFVKILEESGFSALRHKLHFHTILTTPILLVAMVLIASVFSIRFSRQNRNSILISGAVFTGFVFYFIAKLIASFGLAGNMPIIMAAWTPAIIFILIGIWAQLNLEDS